MTKTNRVRRTTASRLQRTLRNEHGIAMPMVLAIFIVGFALVTAFTVSVVSSAHVSTTTRTSVQAQAAAEAGLAAGQVALHELAVAEQNFCTDFSGLTLSDLNPGLTVTVTAACDDNAAPTEVTVTSVAANNTDAEELVTLAAVLPVTGPSAGETPLTTAGMYLRSITSSGNTSFVSDLAEPPSMVVVDQDFVCNGSQFSTPGDFYIASGNAHFQTGCRIGGTIYTDGNVIIDNGGSNSFNSVHAVGNVELKHALGTAANPGNVYAGGNLTVRNVANFSIGSAHVGGSVVIERASGLQFFTAEGRINARGSIAVNSGAYDEGRYFENRPTVIPHSVPGVEGIPSWVDYTYSKTAWEDAGYQERKVTGGNCVVTYNAAVDGAQPTVVDATECTRVTLRGSYALQNHFAIIAKSIRTDYWGAATFTSVGGNEKQLTLITPDTVPDNQTPNCPAGSTGIMLEGTTISAPLRVNIYTPCSFSSRGNQIRAAIFAPAFLNPGNSNNTISLTEMFLPGAGFGQSTDPTIPGSGGSGTGPTVPELRNGLGTTPTSQRSVG